MRRSNISDVLRRLCDHVAPLILIFCLNVRGANFFPFFLVLCNLLSFSPGQINLFQLHFHTASPSSLGSACFFFLVESIVVLFQVSYYFPFSVHVPQPPSFDLFLYIYTIGPGVKFCIGNLVGPEYPAYPSQTGVMEGRNFAHISLHNPPAL